MSYFTARQDCVRRGGDLAKLSSLQQLDVLRNSGLLTAVKYWIGLVGLVWYWPDGTRHILDAFVHLCIGVIFHECVYVSTAMSNTVC